jgi:hypothetical protein
MRLRSAARRWSLLGGLLLVLTLGGCAIDCPVCPPLPVGPQAVNVDFELCVAQVPEPTVGQDGCSAMRVKYVVVND